jgi:predicted ABC-type ATPase
MSGKRLFLVAGPNGVGKTTFAFRRIREITGSAHFVNLDEIARGLSPLDPALARAASGRVALSRIRMLTESGATFAVETTLAGRTHMRTIRAAREAGYRVTLFYFFVPSVDECLRRVARRVMEGGHDVPESDVRRRFGRSIANLTSYLDAVDDAVVFDNSDVAARAVIERDGSGQRIVVPEPFANMPAALSTLFQGAAPHSRGTGNRS